MRAVEKKIIDKLVSGKKGIYMLFDHDKVVINETEARVYLWDTCIFRATKADRFYYFSSIAAESSLCMSATTASRISAIQSHYVDTQVYRRDYRIRSRKDDSQLKTGVWYKADDEKSSGYVIHMPIKG